MFANVSICHLFDSLALCDSCSSLLPLGLSDCLFLNDRCDVVVHRVDFFLCINLDTKVMALFTLVEYPKL